MVNKPIDIVTCLLQYFETNEIILACQSRRPKTKKHFLTMTLTC